MANKVLNTRVQLKYDSYTNWSTNGGTRYETAPSTGKYDGFVPLAGEVCICTAGTINPGQDDVLLKVGDGVKNWASLPWVSAKAADVHDWAKKSWDEFKSEILPVITAAVQGGNEITESVSGNTVTLNHNVKLVGGFTGASATATGEKDKAFTITVPKLVVNEYGHITSAVDVTYTVTVPTDHKTVVTEGAKIDVEETVSGDTTTYKVKHEETEREDATVEAVAPAAKENFTVVDSIVSDDYGHVTSVKTKTVTLPEDKDTQYEIVTTENSEKGVVALNADGVEDSTVNFVGNDAVKVTSDANGTVTISAHDTKYNTTTTASSTDGQLNITEDGTIKETTIFKGADAVTVTSDKNNNITISAHDTKYAVAGVDAGADAKVELSADGSVSSSVLFKAGNNVSLDVDSSGITINSAYSNTEYTAGDGLSLIGTEFSHANTSDVSSVSATDRTYVNSVTFDEFGHVVAIGTATETVVDTNTVTTVTGDNKYISVTDSSTSGNHEYVVSAIESELKTLIANETTAAMEFEGVITEIPTLTAVDKGHFYKIGKNDIIVNDTKLKIGDGIVWDGSNWHIIPSGDDIENTWRTIRVDGVDITSNVDLNFVSGDATVVSVTEPGDGKANLKYSHADTSTQTDIVKTGRKYVAGLTFDDYGHVTGVDLGEETIEHNPDIKIVTGDTGSFTADVDGDTLSIKGDGTWTTTVVSGDEVKINHKTSGVTAGSVSGTSSAANIAHGSEVVIPSLSVDEAGHVTSTGTTSFKLPTHTAVNISENPDSASLIVTKTTSEKDTNGNDTVTYNVYHKQYNTSNVTKANDGTVAHGGTFKAITGLSFEEGHVTGVDTTTYTLPAETKSYGEIHLSNSTATSAVTGNTAELKASKPGSNFTLATGNKWLSVAGSDAADDTVDTITLGHSLSGITAGNFTPTFTDNTLTVYETTVDAAGHITGMAAKNFSIDAVDTNTTYSHSALVTRNINDASIDKQYDAIDITLRGSDDSEDKVYIAVDGAIALSERETTVSGDTATISLTTTDEFSQVDNTLAISKVNVRKIEQEKDAQGNVVEEDILILNCGNASGWTN